MKRTYSYPPLLNGSESAYLYLLLRGGFRHVSLGLARDTLFYHLAIAAKLPNLSLRWLADSTLTQ